MYMLIMPVGHLSEFYQRNCHLLSHVWRCLTMSATFMNISSHDWNNYGHVFKMFEPCCDTDRCLHVFNMLWHGSNLKYNLICPYVLRTYWMCMEHFFITSKHVWAYEAMSVHKLVLSGHVPYMDSTCLGMCDTCLSISWNGLIKSRICLNKSGCVGNMCETCMWYVWTVSWHYLKLLNMPGTFWHISTC